LAQTSPFRYSPNMVSSTMELHRALVGLAAGGNAPAAQPIALCLKTPQKLPPPAILQRKRPRWARPDGNFSTPSGVASYFGGADVFVCGLFAFDAAGLLAAGAAGFAAPLVAGFAAGLAGAGTPD
jgi:hypothetical protein